MTQDALQRRAKCTRVLRTGASKRMPPSARRRGAAGQRNEKEKQEKKTPAGVFFCDFAACGRQRRKAARKRHPEQASRETCRQYKKTHRNFGEFTNFSLTFLRKTGKIKRLYPKVGVCRTPTQEKKNSIPRRKRQAHLIDFQQQIRVYRKNDYIPAGWQNPEKRKA